MRQQILNLFTTPRDMSWEDILLNIVLAAVLGFLSSCPTPSPTAGRSTAASSTPHSSFSRC